MSAFTKPRKKNFRKRKQSSDSDLDSDENGETRSKLEDIRELQKARERQKGVDIVGLALGKKIPKTEDVDSRSSNWSERDKILAIELVLQKEEELYGLCKGKYTNRMKQDNWINVTEDFNLKADEIRTVDQLKKCFENIRGSARKYIDDLKLAKMNCGMVPREPKPSVKLIIDKIRHNPNIGRVHPPFDPEDADLDVKWNIRKLSSDESCPINNSISDTEESNSTRTREFRETVFDGHGDNHPHIESSSTQTRELRETMLDGRVSSHLPIGKHDPFKMKTGGFIDMKALKTQGSTMLTEEEKDAIGTAFAAETNRRDEDAEMAKFVEDELKRRKGVQTEERRKSGGSEQTDALYELPDHLASVTSKFKKSEDMLSNQMLSGIPEIDLGIEAKIKNIEETEEAKQKLIQERMKKKETVSEFVPTNMAVNFVQHNRFNIEDTAPILKKEEPVPVKQARVEDPELKKKNANPLTVQPDEKATDNYHFDRFKKHMRR